MPHHSALEPENSPWLILFTIVDATSLLSASIGLYLEKYIQYVLNVKDMQTRKLFTLELIEYQ